MLLSGENSASKPHTGESTTTGFGVFWLRGATSRNAAPRVPAAAGKRVEGTPDGAARAGKSERAESPGRR